MFVLHERTCMLGGDHSGKTTEKDGRPLKLLTFELERIPLDAAEVNALFGHPFAWNRLHHLSIESVDKAVHDKGEAQFEPFLPGLKSLEFANPLEGACVTIKYGLQIREMRFVDCKLSKITLTLEHGGETYLSCKVTSAPALDETLAELFDQFGKKITCELRSYPPDAQKDLPLNQHGEGEQSEQPRKRGRGRPRKSGGEARAH